MIPINNGNRKSSIDGDGDYPTSHRDLIKDKNCFICNNTNEKLITFKKLVKKEIYRNFLIIEKRLNTIERDLDSEVDETYLDDKKLYNICTCGKLAHVKCLLKHCIIKMSLSCSKCNQDYFFYFEKVKLTPKEKSEYCSKFFFLILVLALFLGGSLFLFIFDLRIPDKYLFWKYVVGLFLILIDCFIIISSIDCMKSLNNKLFKTRIKYSETRPESNDDIVKLAQENAQKFHYYIKGLLGVEITNQLKEKIIFNKYLDLEIKKSNHYWNTIDNCNETITKIKNDIECNDEDEYPEYNKKPSNLKSPLKRAVSRVMMGKNNNKVLLSPLQKKISSPRNVKDEPTKIVFKQGTSNSNNKEKSPKPNPVTFAGEEIKDLLQLEKAKSESKYQKGRDKENQLLVGKEDSDGAEKLLLKQN